jgi:hypothetical protein
MTAFFRKHLLYSSEFDGILNGDSAPPPSALTSAIYTAYLPGQADRKDLNRLFTSAELTTNTLGGAATATSFAASVQCGDWTGVHCMTTTQREPHFASLSALELGWTTTSADYANQLPAGQRDVSSFDTIQFRLAVDSSDPRNPAGQAQDFTVKISSPAGSASVPVSTFTRALYYPPGSAIDQAAVMNTVRIPLSAFPGVDRSNVTSVEMLFNRKSSGDVLVSDVAFSRRPMSVAEMWLASTQRF